MADVSLKNVSKIFPPDIRAVQNISLEIPNKEFLVLVGPSGCGKSTTLRLVAGLEEATEGDIFIDGRKVNDVPPKDRDIAMVFQNYALYPHMTAYKNMAFGLKLRRYPRAEIESRVKEAAEILGITHLLNRRPKELSGGERQRVAVGRAIVRKPKVFLFDEPLSNLDAKMRVQMRTEISKLHNRLQATIIYVTHDQVEAMTMGSRIAVMKDGIIHQTDSPLHLYNKPVNKFVAGFIGSPPMNFFEGQFVADGGRLYFNDGVARFEVDAAHREALKRSGNAEITFGIRPEDISICESVASRNSAVESMVEVVEPMGSEIYLYLNTGRSAYVARVKTDMEIKVDSRLCLQFNMQKAHFFDKNTENAIE
jgi:multiple sugar transport system ATP-binding protein